MREDSMSVLVGIPMILVIGFNDDSRFLDS